MTDITQMDYICYAKTKNKEMFAGIKYQQI